MLRDDGFPTVGLAIIAKDEAGQIENLLDSVGWTDQIEDSAVEMAEEEGNGMWRPEAAVDCVVVCDTGSSDETKAIAARRGCTVVDFEWVDDFSKARQASFDALPEEIHFTLWADCDDVIENAGDLRLLGLRMPLDAVASIHRYNYAQDPAGNCICELWRERLVRKGFGEWRLPVHEVQNLPPNSAIRDASVVWHHRVDPQRVEKRDPERNYKILRKAYDNAVAAGETPDPRTVAYLGTEAITLEDHREEAEPLFREYLEHAEAGVDEELCQVSHKLSVAIRHGKDGPNRLSESAEAAHLALQHRPDWPDGYLDLAEIALMQNDSQKALHWVEIAESLKPPQTMLIINPLEYTYQPLILRAQANANLGRFTEAQEALQNALAYAPYLDHLQQLGLELAQQKLKADTIARVMDLRELLLRHDESVKANTLMQECVPYIIESDPLIAHTRLRTRQMTLHATEPEVYSDYYATNPTSAPFAENQLDVNEAQEYVHRLRMLREYMDSLPKPNGDLRILDLTCSDGWMLENLYLSGYGVGEKGALDGNELSEFACSVAAKKAEQWGGRVVCDDLHRAAWNFSSGSYDVVILFETIEHVPEPERTMAVCSDMAGLDGAVLVSTPDGAFDRGNVPYWDKDESRGHLRIFTRHDLMALMQKFGRVEDLQVDNRVQTAAMTVRPRRQRIVFYAGPVSLMPEQIRMEGLGGSETALIKMAEGFAQRGHEVVVYAGLEDGGIRGDSISTDQPPVEGTVLYAPYTLWDPAEYADLFIASRAPDVFQFTVNSPNRILWLHDADYQDRLTEHVARQTTEIVVLSDFQRELLVGMYPHIEEKVRVSRNGIEPTFFDEPLPKKKPWVVYSSSPDRGLDVLLKAWPRVVEKVPDAELHHFYAPVYAEMRDSGQMPHLVGHWALIEELIEKTKGVVNRGPQPQHKLAEIYRQARVWGYPSWHTPGGAAFPEISCITAMEAMAAGAVPVTLEFGALPETILNGVLIPPDVEDGKLTDAWLDGFADAIVAVLKNPDDWTGRIEENRKHAMTLGWSGVVDEWEARYLSADGDRREAGRELQKLLS